MNMHHFLAIPHAENTTRLVNWGGGGGEAQNKYHAVANIIAQCYAICNE